jgi:hypothetical protein
MVDRPSTSKIDAWLAQASLPELERELVSQEEAMRDRVDEWEREREKINADIEILRQRRRLIDVLRDVGSFNGSETGMTGAERHPRPQLEFSAIDPETKPEIVVRALESAGEGLYPREVRNIAVGHRWLPEDPASANQLTVAMNKMRRNGRLLRDTDGRYYLPEWRDNEEIILGELEDFEA